MVFATQDQKATTIAHLFAKEAVPIARVPEGLLSDHGTDLCIIVSHVGYL